MASTYNEWVLYLLLACALFCIPLAYAMGKIAGGDEVRRSIRRHPSMGARNTVNQLDRAA